ncbi:tetratricopeptide repeat protein [Rhodoligotrophos ferricapiens]|uniref:tetratricopeptide repeat protein n=1 Tax=Rhodoligotrophos ferricapiens TaxID=3069264 RepID=UPI00315CD4F9
MSVSSRAHGLSLFCVALLMSVAWVSPASSQGAAVPPAVAPQSPLPGAGSNAKPAAPLPAMPPSPTEAARQRADLLDSLFARLHGAESRTSAQILQEAVLQLWRQSGSPSVDVLIQQADRAARSKQYQTALTILDTVVEIAPDFPEGWNKRATVLYLQGDSDRAIADIDRVLELEPRHFGALAALGMIRRANGDIKGALEAFQRVLEINPHMEEAKDAVKKLEKEAGQAI